MKIPSNFEQFTVTVNTDMTVLLHGMLDVNDIYLLNRSFILLEYFDF